MKKCALLSLLCALALALLLGTAVADEQLPKMEAYYNATYLKTDGSTGTMLCTTYNPAAAEITTGWYAVWPDYTFQIGHMVTVSGNVNLVLPDDSRISFNAGLYVPSGSSLTTIIVYCFPSWFRW